MGLFTKNCRLLMVCLLPMMALGNLGQVHADESAEIGSAAEELRKLLAGRKGQTSGIEDKLRAVRKEIDEIIAPDIDQINTHANDLLTALKAYKGDWADVGLLERQPKSDFSKLIQRILLENKRQTIEFMFGPVEFLKIDDATQAGIFRKIEIENEVLWRSIKSRALHVAFINDADVSKLKSYSKQIEIIINNQHSINSKIFEYSPDTIDSFNIMESSADKLGKNYYVNKYVGNLAGNLTEILEEKLEGDAKAARDDILNDRRLILTKLKQAIEKRIELHVPRIFVVSAEYGDLRRRRPRGRRCNATAAVKSMCHRQKACKLTQTEPQNLCGRDPVPFANPKIKGAIIAYKCVEGGDAEWHALEQLRPGQVSGLSYATVRTNEESIICSSSTPDG